jgi:uncharacterized cupin superfamily protein
MGTSTEETLMSAVLDRPVCALPFAAKLHVPDAPLQAWPLPEDRVLSGRPEASGELLAQSADGSVVRGIWACTPGAFRWDWTVDEMVTVVSGRATVALSDGRVIELAPGDIAFFETGLSAVWTIHTPFRKSFHTLKAQAA